jgi:hypothetical protein
MIKRERIRRIRRRWRGDLERKKWKLGREGMVGTVKPWERKERRGGGERERVCLEG